jgi:GntR family transcriptional regulator
MLLNLTDLSDEPLQSQISKQIRAKILSGEMAAGDTLPSIRRLARDQHVSVITVQRGYDNLEREGLIHSRRGKGFFVSELDRSSKKEMARDRLVEKIEPIIDAAFSEGMLDQDILAVFKSILARRHA